MPVERERHGQMLSAQQLPIYLVGLQRLLVLDFYISSGWDHP